MAISGFRPPAIVHRLLQAAAGCIGLTRMIQSGRNGIEIPQCSGLLPGVQTAKMLSARFRTIQVYPKDLRALPVHPEPGVSWHISGFREESPCST